jgi:hypothetical protein
MSVEVVIVVVSHCTIAIVADFVACRVVAIANGDTFFRSACVCTCMHKNLVQQQKIADASKPHQKLIPVRIRGVPVWGVRQKNSHMGRHITCNEVVRIRGLTYSLLKNLVIMTKLLKRR